MKLVISENPIAFSLIKSSFRAAWLSWLWDTFIVELILLIKNLLQKVIKVIWYKTTSPPQTDSSVVFARWRQCALPSGHIGVTWWIQLNLCFLRPSQVHNPNGKSISLAVSAQLMAVSPYTLQWATLSPKLPLLMGDLESHVIRDSFSQSEHTIRTASRSVQLFLHRWLQSVPMLYNGTPLSLSKLPLPMEDLDPM